MCSFAKSSEAKQCRPIQSLNLTPSFSRKLHPNPSVPTYPYTKTKLHTKPRSISSCRRKAAPHSQTIGPYNQLKSELNGFSARGG